MGAPDPGAPPAGGAPAPGRGAKGDLNELASVTFTFRGVSLAAVSGKPEANKSIAYDVLKELQENPLFDKEGTKTSTDVMLDEQTGTFTFSIVAQLKHPLKL